MVVRDGQLNPHEDRFDAGDHQEEQRVDDVHQAEVLVIDRHHPFVQPSPAAFAQSVRTGQHRSSSANAAVMLSAHLDSCPSTKRKR